MAMEKTTHTQSERHGNGGAIPSVSVDPFPDDAPSELAAVRGGEELDWGRIETFLRSNLPDELDLTGSFEVMQFPNGAANLTYLVRFADLELVLRRPPFGTLAPGAPRRRCRGVENDL